MATNTQTYTNKNKDKDRFTLFDRLRPKSEAYELGDGIKYYDDHSVWSDDVGFAPIGSFDPNTGKFEESWWVKGAKVFDIINKPFEWFGVGVASPFRLLNKEVREDVMKKAGPNASLIDYYKILDEQYRDMPIWKQIVSESPLMLVLPGAIQLKGYLAGVKGGAKGALASVAKAGLYLPAKADQIQAKILSKAIGEPLSKIYHMTPAYKNKLAKLAQDSYTPEQLRAFRFIEAMGDYDAQKLPATDEGMMLAEGVAKVPDLDTGLVVTPEGPRPEAQLKYYDALDAENWRGALYWRGQAQKFDTTNPQASHPSMLTTYLGVPQFWDFSSEGQLKEFARHGRIGGGWKNVEHEVAGVKAGVKPVALLHENYLEGDVVRKAEADPALKVVKYNLSEDETEWITVGAKTEFQKEFGYSPTKKQLNDYIEDTYMPEWGSPLVFVYRKGEYTRAKANRLRTTLHDLYEARWVADNRKGKKYKGYEEDVEAITVIPQEIELGRLLGYTDRDIAKYLVDNFGWHRIKKSGMYNSTVLPEWSSAYHATLYSREDFIRGRLADEPVQKVKWSKDVIKDAPKYSGSEPVDPDKIYDVGRQRLDSEHRWAEKMLVMYDETGKPKAYTSMSHFTDEGTGKTHYMIDVTVVDPKLQGKGIGERLYNEAINQGAFDGHIENAVSAGLKHKIFVKRALANGNPVSYNALKSYPELLKKAMDLDLVVGLEAPYLYNSQKYLTVNGGAKLAEPYWWYTDIKLEGVKNVAAAHNRLLVNLVKDGTAPAAVVTKSNLERANKLGLVTEVLDSAKVVIGKDQAAVDAVLSAIKGGDSDAMYKALGYVSHEEQVKHAFYNGRKVPGEVLEEYRGKLRGVTGPYVSDVESLFREEGEIVKGRMVHSDVGTFVIDPAIPTTLINTSNTAQDYLEHGFTYYNPKINTSAVEELLEMAVDMGEDVRLLNWATQELNVPIEAVGRVGRTVNSAKSIFNPGLKLLSEVHTPYYKANWYQNQQNTRIMGTVMAMESAIEGLWGKDAIKNGWRGFRDNYVGSVTPGSGLDNIVGSLPHVFENPSKYKNITPEMARVIDKWHKIMNTDKDFTNATLNSGLKNWVDFIGETEGLYVPHAFRSAKMMEEGLLSRSKPTLKRRLTFEEYANIAKKWGVEVEDNMTTLLSNRLSVSAKMRTRHMFLESAAKNVGVKSTPISTGKNPLSLSVHGFGRYYNFSGNTKAVKAGQEVSWLLNPKPTPDTERYISDALDFGRSALLNLDVGIIMRQGFAGVITDPVASCKGIWDAVGLIQNKRGWLDWYSRNYRRLTDWEGSGLQFRTSLIDITSGIKGQEKNIIDKVPVIKWLNDAQFGTTIPVMKVHLADSLLGNMQALRDAKGFWGEFNQVINSVPVLGNLNKKLGGKLYEMSDKELMKEVSDVVNNLMGGIDWERIGKTPGMFSKLFVLTEGWTRAQLGLFSSTLSTSPRGIMARRILAQELAMGAIVSSAISISSTGEMPEFDPTSTRFMDVKTPFGFVSILPHKAYFTSFVRMATGKGNTYTDDDGRLNRMADATMWFLQSRSGQLPRVMKDLVSGTDFMGREIDNEWKYLSETLTPIIVGDALEEMRLGYAKKDPGAFATRLAISLTGANPRPYSPTYIRAQVRNEIAKQMGYKDWFEMPKTEQDRAFRHSQSLQDLDKEATEYQRMFQNSVEKLIADGREWADTEFYTRMDKIAQAYMRGQITKKEYDDERAYLRNSYSGQKGLTSYLTNLNDPHMEARFAKWYDEHPLPPEDQAVEEYINIGLRTEEELGAQSWDIARARQLAYLKTLPDSYQEYVLARQYDWMNGLPAASKALEIRRRQMISSGAWWDNYRGTSRSTGGRLVRSY